MKWSGLIRKLLAGILVIEVLMLSILVYNSVRLLSSTHSELFERTINEEVTLLSSLLVGGLSVRDLALINENLQLFSRQANVKYAIVYDRRHQVMGQVGEVPRDFKRDLSFNDAQQDGIYDTEFDVQLEGEVFGTLRAGFSVQEIAQLSNKAQLQNTIIAATEILLTILVTLLVGYYLIKRINSLQTGARYLQEGKFSYQIPVNDKDELGELADAFNKLGASLNKSNKELLEKQQELQQKALHFSSLLNSVNAVIFEALIDPFRIIFVNKEAENLLGYPPAEWHRAYFCLDIVYEADRAIMELFMENPSSPRFSSFDYRVRKSNGEYVWLRQITNIEKSGEHKSVHGVLIDVTKEKHNADVERTRDVALAEIRTKNLFLANMSHELRTPLNAIIGYTELIAEENENEEVMDKKMMADDLDKITRSAKHLLSLINEVLDISRINSGKFDLQISTFNMAQMLDDVVDVISPLAEKKGNRLVLELGNDFELSADRQRLYQVVVNLCANACKFTENGEIKISISYEQNWDTYQIHISDTGIGIKPDELDLVFKEFERTQDVAKTEGTGLGLCLSQKLCKIMGGYITVASNYGKGSVFSVSMPLVVEPLEQKQKHEIDETQVGAVYENIALNGGQRKSAS